jgi:MFS family permease
MFKRWLSSLQLRNQPWMTRQSFAHERVASTAFPVAIAMVEGGVMGVLAQKAFAVGPNQLAAIMAAPMFANLTSFFWARLARGRRKIRAIATLQVLAALCVGAVACLPTGPTGAWLLTALVIVARCMVAGIVTLRSTVWRMNYPRPVRGQVTGRLVQLQTLVVTVAPLLGYPLLDWHAQMFRVLYPAAMVVAMIGAGAFSKVRLRGERSLLRFERQPSARPQPHGETGAIYEYDPKAEPAGQTTFIDVLKQDWRFRRYMIWMFAAGMANMSGEVALVWYVAQLTNGRPFEYLTSITLTTAIPMVVALVTLPYWAKKLDQMHVSRFRVRQSGFWIGCQLGHFLGAWTGSLALLLLPRILQGVARGGGMLAWNLGHNDFADRRLVALYMGIHVTMTGLRGAMVPFVAMMLLRGWSPLALPWSDAALPGFAGLGAGVFLFSLTCAFVAMLGFVSLHRAVQRHG